jgi:hypothetical protein
VLFRSGNKELIAELVRVGDDHEIRFMGGSTELRERVIDAFTERTGEQSYTTTDLREWLQDRVLVGAFHAVRWGGFFWCPGGAESKATITTVINTVHDLLGREIAIGEAANPKAMSGGIAKSLASDVAVIVKAYDAALTKAQTTAREKCAAENGSEADQDLAIRRAVVSPEVAGNRLRELERATGRVEGFRELIGPELYAPIRATIDSLKSKLSSQLTDGHMRAAMLELE